VSAAPALSLEHVAKRFGTTEALVDASLVVRAGTVHALLGENGAGKTTLMRVAFGMVRADAGHVRVEGREVHLASPADALAAGLGMVHQHFTLVGAMTVAENVALARGAARGAWRFDARAAAERVRDIARRTGLALDPDAPAGELPVSAQQRLEIAKAVSRDARTLILDEPTAVLAPREADDLLAWARRFADAGHAVVLITHKLREALSVADDVTVLRRGRTVATLKASDATADSLAALMLGAEPVGASRSDARREAPGAPVARAAGLVVRDERGVERVRGVTFEVRRGEILGVAGVEGAGQRELLRALAGRLAVRAGALERPARVAFIPDDRQRDALVLDFPLPENVALRGAGRRRGLMRWREVARRTAALVAQFAVRAGSLAAPVRTLSGGNQQRLVLARELADAPELVVADNPTRGLDIRATAVVHDRLRAARDAGAAVVVYSSDLDEVLALADRVLALFGGQGRVAEPDRDTVGRLMLGAT
jgi:simple sugar transport system ATP-binding protein